MLAARLISAAPGKGLFKLEGDDPAIVQRIKIPLLYKANQVVFVLRRPRKRWPVHVLRGQGETERACRVFSGCAVYGGRLRRAEILTGLNPRKGRSCEEAVFRPTSSVVREPCCSSCAALSRRSRVARQGFHFLTADREGVKIAIDQAVFCYEEKINVASFIPPKLRTLPVKRGSATVHVTYETIKQVEFELGLGDEALPTIVTLTNGKGGEFQVAIAGNVRGLSGFDDVQVRASGITKVLFR